MANAFKFTHAVVCRLPDSFEKNAVGTKGVINLEKAKQQHSEYVSTLRRLGLDVVELPPDEQLPDCVFVEDTAVVVNGQALITRYIRMTRYHLSNSHLILKIIICT